MKLAAFEVPANVDVILWLIHKCPGLSEREIAERLFGRDTQQLVNGDCALLLNKGLIERRGENPFRLYPVL
jgi:hypothetical protein